MSFIIFINTVLNLSSISGNATYAEAEMMHSSTHPSFSFSHTVGGTSVIQLSFKVKRERQLQWTNEFGCLPCSYCLSISLSLLLSSSPLSSRSSIYHWLQWCECMRQLRTQSHCLLTRALQCVIPMYMTSHVIVGLYLNRLISNGQSLLVVFN